MKLNGKEVLVCNCEGTMTIDGKALAKACQGDDKKGGGKKAEELSVASHLCRTQIEEFQRLAGQGSEPFEELFDVEAPSVVGGDEFLEPVHELSTRRVCSSHLGEPFG